MPGGEGAQDVLLVALLLLAVLLLVLLVRARLSARPGRHARVPVGPDPAQPKPWVAVVANPTKVSDPAARSELIERAGAELGLATPLWLETTVEDPGGGQTREAVRQGAKAVLAYGGDGTVRAVATELCGTGVPLGLLPAGTGNLLARNLAVPVDFAGALRTALGGTERKIDVGRLEVDVTGADPLPRRDTFLVMAGLGFDAEVMASVEPKLKARVGWWAYVVAGARNLRGPQTKVVLRMDDAPPIHRRVRSVVVGNCGELTSGIRLMPEAKVDDGWLDLVIVAPRGIVGWAGVVAAVLSRSRRGHPVVEHFRCREVEIRADEPLMVQLDGDPVGKAKALRAAVDPLALVIRVPDTL